MKQKLVRAHHRREHRRDSTTMIGTRGIDHPVGIAYGLGEQCAVIQQADHWLDVLGSQFVASPGRSDN